MSKEYVGLYRIIRKWANETPAKEAAVIEGERITYGRLKITAEQIAASLYGAGIRQGDRVGILLPNSIRWYTCFWASQILGAVPVPFDPQLGLLEMRELFKKTGIRVCFSCDEFRGINHLNAIRDNLAAFPELKLVIVSSELPQDGKVISFNDFLEQYHQDFSNYQPVAKPEDTLMLVCTSGTTGKPRIILVEHEGFLQSAAEMADYLGFTSSEVMLLGMPLYHQGGFGMGMQVLLKGGTVIFQESFTPRKFLKLIGEENVTVIQLSATLAKILLSTPDLQHYDLSSLRMAYFAGEVLPDELAAVFYHAMALDVINIMGSSEATSMLVWDSRTDKPFPVNDFKALPFTKVKILDENGSECSENQTGLINIHTKAVLREYFRNPRETAKRIKWIDGKRWFDTGDLGQLLPGGRVRFTGREKRIIKRGSNLIYPEEIESCLLTHPLIAAVAVVGEKDDVYGERTVAYIQVAEETELDHGALFKFCRGKLSAYKLPDRFIIHNDIPKNIGKIQYKYLREKESPLMQKLSYPVFNQIYNQCLAEVKPEATALIYRDQRITFRELKKRILIYKWCLRKIGVTAGTHVAYSLLDCPAIIYLLFAVNELGGCAIPIHTQAPAGFKIDYLAGSETTILITETFKAAELKTAAAEKHLDLLLVTLEPAAAADYCLRDLITAYLPENTAAYTPAAEDTLLLMSTSGTTGLPKLAEISQANLANAIRGAAYLIEPLEDFEAGIRSLIAFPLSTSAMFFLLAILLLGGTLVLLDDYSPLHFLDLIKKWQVEVIGASPAYYEALVNLPQISHYDLSSVRRLYSGMDIFSNSLISRLRRKFSNVTITATGYGLVESSTAVLGWRALQEEDYSIPTNRMLLIPGVNNDIKIIDEHGNHQPTGIAGEIIIKGPHVFRRYYRNPGETENILDADGWLHTGDLGRKSDLNRIEFLGRKKYIIKRGGRNISPVTINTLLLAQPGVADSAVVGVPHPMFGDMIWAFIVQERNSGLKTGDLIKSCRENLPAFMIPDRIELLAAIPRNPGVGKVNHDILIKQAEAILLKNKGGV